MTNKIIIRYLIKNVGEAVFGCFFVFAVRKRVGRLRSLKIHGVEYKFILW